MHRITILFLFLLLQSPLFMFGQVSKEPVYDYVNQPATFPGGDYALSQYLHQHIDYNQTGIKNKMSGPVVVVFVVEKDGSISNIELRISLKRELDKQVLEAVRNMPPWKPAKLMGKTVRSKNQVRVEFFAQQKVDYAEQLKKMKEMRYAVQRGIFAYENQWFRYAVAYFSIFLAEHPKDSAILSLRGAALYNLDRKREACIDWKDAQTVESKEIYAAFCEGMRGVKYHTSVDTNYQKFLDTLAVLDHCSLDFDSAAHFSDNPDALRKYYKKNMKSSLVREFRIPTVILSFDVTETGNVENIWIVRKYNTTYDNEAIRLVAGMPQWIPATKEGKNVKSKILFRIDFNDKSTKTGKFIHDFFER
jgi:TonB family protein